MGQILKSGKEDPSTEQNALKKKTKLRKQNKF